MVKVRNNLTVTRFFHELLKCIFEGNIFNSIRKDDIFAKFIFL